MQIVLAGSYIFPSSLVGGLNRRRCDCRKFWCGLDFGATGLFKCLFEKSKGQGARHDDDLWLNCDFSRDCLVPRCEFVNRLAVLPVLDEVIDDGWVGQRGGIAQI